ncbi:MAG: hypothetical protein J7574_19960 [Flavobacterium sp.]|uniref:hypothetical protein n=1 Tax=Flavobacterium sp. TaxID=239 RepID=UPI001B0C5C93|nr:hypothetical protein [Flavobacterium sp.]MBO9586447.1 hypothetical protein [Flavobacterium sp.]
MMKNLQKIQILFMFLLLASCAADKVEKDEIEVTNPKNVWVYNGDNIVLKNVIEELKESEYAASLERRLSKNEVLWQEAKFLLIENKKRILVPFLSTDKENVIGVLALVKDGKGKTTFDMTSRTQLKTTNKLPFWNKGTWRGYFMALDAKILGIKNGNPGLVQRKASEEKLSEMFGTSTAKSLKICAQRWTGFYVSFYATEEECDGDLESTYCYYTTRLIVLPEYEQVCWEDDQPAPPDPQPPLPGIENPENPNSGVFYNNMNFSPATFLGYVNAETYEISPPVINNIYGEGCTTNVKIVTNVFTLNIEIEQLLNRSSTIPFYYVNGVSPSPLTNFSSHWVDSNNTDHWMGSYNNYFENSISIVEYEGENKYKVNGGSILYNVPVKYKIEINSHTGEILSITRID